MVKMTKTIMRKRENVQHEWYVVNATDKIVGRVATQVAHLLKGKHKVDFTPHVDNGAGVVVLNCDKMRVTGSKAKDKMYKTFSGYPRGQRVTPYEDVLIKSPKNILRHAVKGMLPKTKLGARMIKRLKLYTGDTHTQTAQKPAEYKVK
jgi:large subunit ribosomal protein L13